MEYTKEEKIAIITAIAFIAEADKKTTSQEWKVLFKVQTYLEIPMEEVQAASNMNLVDCITILEKISEQAKLDFGAMMIDVMEKDGHVDQREMEMVESICTGIGTSINSVKKYISENRHVD